MTTGANRPAQAFREALRLLEAEPPPMTAERSELIAYIRKRIEEHELLDRATTNPEL